MMLNDSNQEADSINYAAKQDHVWKSDPVDVNAYSLGEDTQLCILLHQSHHCIRFPDEKILFILRR